MSKFWKMNAFNISKIFKIKLPCSAATLFLNDLSKLELTLDVRRTLLAGLRAAKKTSCNTLETPTFTFFPSMDYLDMAVYLELSIAGVHGAKESSVNAWSSLLSILREFQV